MTTRQSRWIFEYYAYYSRKIENCKNFFCIFRKNVAKPCDFVGNHEEVGGRNREEKSDRVKTKREREAPRRSRR